MIRRLALTLPLLLLAAGCDPNAPRVSQGEWERNYCSSGFEPGSREYSHCVTVMARQRERRDP